MSIKQSSIFLVVVIFLGFLALKNSHAVSDMHGGKIYSVDKALLSAQRFGQDTNLLSLQAHQAYAASPNRAQRYFRGY